jgi:type II secretory pathway pseudopilin PulG
MKNQRGFSLVQGLVAMGILSGAMYLFMTGQKQISDELYSEKNKVYAEVMVNGLIQNLKNNLPAYARNYRGQQIFLPLSEQPASDIETKLSYAWKEDRLVPKDQCPTCPGRLGFSIMPVADASMRGLYQVVVLLTHPKVFGEQVRRYEFIVSE